VNPTVYSRREVLQDLLAMPTAAAVLAACGFDDTLLGYGTIRVA
jgi:hypothetical protein